MLPKANAKQLEAKPIEEGIETPSTHTHTMKAIDNKMRRECDMCCHNVRSVRMSRVWQQFCLRAANACAQYSGVWEN